MESDLTFPQIIDGLSAPIATTAADGRVELANRHFLAYLGLSLEELKNWETSGVVHPDDLARVLDIWRQSLQRGEPFEMELRVRRADGTYQWVQVRGLPLRDSASRIVRWCVLLTDIADRKRAEALLDGEKRLLEMVASGCPLEDVLEAMCRIVDTIVGESVCSILLIDRTGRFRYGAGPMLPAGYDVAVNGAPVASDAGPCGTAASSNRQVIVPDLVSDPRWVGLGWRTLVLDHGLRSVCSTPIMSSTGAVLGTFAIYQHEPGRPSALLTDLIARFTHVASIAIERQISHQHLQERERESRMIVDSIPGMVALLTASGDVEVVNPQLIEYFGQTVGQLRQWRMTDTIHPEDLPHVIEAFTRSIATGNPYEIVQRFRRSDGMYRWFLNCGLPVRDPSGQIARWCVLLTDIDERKRAQDALDRARSELAHVARVTTASAFTASIAHEVNQPLSGIITNAGTCLRMLAAEPPDVDGARETTKRTLRDGNRAADVISRLRALFSKREFALELLDINEVTQEVIALSLSELQRNRVLLRSEFTSELPPVTGDRIQLQQVILNLLRNASDAMMSVDDRPRQLVIGTGEEADHRVRLTVRDAGVGLDAESMNKLFDAFFTTKSAGMGIGLAVSRSIIERHHGRLWAEPNDGPGATFAFAIPAAQATGARAINTKV
jgi:PAS domain S-box-containing protein